MNQQPVNNLLRQTRILHTQNGVINVRAVHRCEMRDHESPPYFNDAIRQYIDSDKNNDHLFTFIDLFAGIGGIRLGFEAHRGHCVFTSEWNSFSQKTYLANFQHDDKHILAGDITSIDANDVPNHDVLLAGFPCQPFSIAGVSKKMR